ncbi:MAG: beta-lactamase family protein [Muribaculaceae bacterium]|nr:beta-lactamase family protein [Muribaculaceae bacterium]
MKTNRIIMLWTTALLAVSAMAISKKDMKQFRQQVNQVFEQVYSDPMQPGAAVLIRQGDKTIFEQCYGKADLESGADVTPTTNFCIASVSKQFSAVALLQLVEQGKLSLQTTMSQMFPEWTQPFYQRVTVHHLLSHTSGIPDARPRDDRHFVLTATDVASVGFMATLQGLEFEPGSQYKYQNPTFQLAYQIVPRYSGEDFEDYMSRHIFKKVGMKHTQYFADGREMPNSAHGYRWDKSQGRYVEFDYGEETFFATKADGGLYTSVRDFARWEQALRDGKVWSPVSRAMAYTPHVWLQPDANYGYQPNVGYGYGFFIQQTPGRPKIVYHTGDNGGFTIYAGKVPERDITFMFFSTRDDIDRMAIVNRVWDIIFSFI